VNGWTPTRLRLAAMDSVAAVILAAGQGTRMRSELAKPLHEICGRPMVLWPVTAALEAGADKVVVVGGADGAVQTVLPDDVDYAVQADPRGTGHAVLAAAPYLEGTRTTVVLAGDVPLVTAETISGLLATHEASRAAATMVTMELEDAAEYGRVVRNEDGSVARVAEVKGGGVSDEVLAIREVNSGVFAFDTAAVLAALAEVEPDAVQNEIFLPEALPILVAAGRTVAAHVIDDPAITLGVNDRADLAVVRAEAQRRIHHRHMLAGVTIVDPACTAIDAGVELGPDTVVEPFTILKGATKAGRACRIGPSTTAIDTLLHDEVTVLHSYLVEAEAHDGASIGPFAYLRPAAVLRAGSKVGTFVEVKNSDIGEGAKVPHLSYIGDADVGERSNLGASTITANYDGRSKHRTTFGAGVRGSVHTSYVAPVTVGDDAYTAAGSVITKDVPPGALGVARARQTNIADYARRVQERVEAEEARATVFDDV
jgi:bifunctional UDP-N-acetylglucosamine pyrophosphorylase / glucosamine-1-phosphate N-acetyltransferase